VVGEGSNIQDNAVVHLADDLDAVIGAWCTIGHGAIVHACTIEDECLIGMGATVLDGARIGARSIVGANSLVPQRFSCPPGSMVYGSPAKVVRPLTAAEMAGLRPWAENTSPWRPLTRAVQVRRMAESDQGFRKIRGADFRRSWYRQRERRSAHETKSWDF
jgi:carbonic anhydrase/acetyltransferase-like protein (isoleucine patch superfamily)